MATTLDPRFGISLHLAVDGLSLLMVILTSFIGVLAILCSWKEIVQRIGFFHLNLLWILGACSASSWRWICSSSSSSGR